MAMWSLDLEDGLKAKAMSSKARWERAMTLQKKWGKLSRQTETETGQKTNLLKNNNLNNK